MRSIWSWPPQGLVFTDDSRIWEAELRLGGLAFASGAEFPVSFFKLLALSLRNGCRKPVPEVEGQFLGGM